MRSLIALAMNPNITNEQFMELSQHMLDSRNKLIKQALDSIKDLPSEQQSCYLSHVMPLLVM